MEKEEFGFRLRETRRQKGYTLQSLAQKAGTGAVYLGEIERGLKMPSLNSFIKITEALDVSADYLLRDELSSGRAYIYDEIAEKLNVPIGTVKTLIHRAREILLSKISSKNGQLF